MVRGAFLGSCYLGICLPESGTFVAAAPQPFSKNTSSSVKRLQALRDKDVVEPISQYAGVECSGTVTYIKPRQRIAVDQWALILEERCKVRRLRASDSWSFIKISKNNNVRTCLNEFINDLANGFCLSFTLWSAASRLR